MLASDTQAIADYLKNIVRQRYGLTEEKIGDKFADTRDTLCYATNDNQTAVSGMLGQEADIAVIVGGRNSSNTSHLVELCEEKLPSFFIRSEDDIISGKTICQYNWRTKQESMVENWLPSHTPARILVDKRCFVS
jgi:4-hydroxy-3-methylbut-2-enyl diphosphate reductase